MPTRLLTAKKLRSAVRRSLHAQGFAVVGDRITFARPWSKSSIRKRHEHAVAKQVALAKQALARHEAELLRFIAAGYEVNPANIQPRLVQVEPDTVESKLFRYACLHWSVPVSQGYGRRMRFLIFDESNGKLMGLFGLGDPVYAIKARDDWIGWDAKAKAERLYHVMDAYVLGAVPPYSRLLGGKLVALVAACDEVRVAFARRYGDCVPLISGKRREPHLVLLTTASALGRSSLYNRVKFRERLVFQSVGFTSGWGEFHFSNGVYEELSAFARRHCVPTAKQEKWGTGFRNRRELVRKALMKLGFGQDLLNHGIRREIFVAPLATNAHEYLRGEVSHPVFYKLPFAEAARFWRERWMLPRSERDSSFRNFDPSEWRLWNQRGDE